MCGLKDSTCFIVADKRAIRSVSDSKILSLGKVCVNIKSDSCFSDDSTSMKYADNGERIKDLEVILERVTEVATLFDHDGLSIRAINRRGD